MVLLYFISVLVILILNADVVPKYVLMIFTDAFTANNFAGDAFLGGLVGGLILLGIRRGAFSNEAGIGTAPMAHGAAKFGHCDVWRAELRPYSRKKWFGLERLYRPQLKSPSA